MKRDMSDSIYVTISAGMKGLRPRADPTAMEDISPVPYAKKKVVIVAKTVLLCSSVCKYKTIQRLWKNLFYFNSYAP